VIERVTVIKFRMSNGGGNGAGCFEVEIWADTAKLTNVIVARFRKCSDLVREGKVFVEWVVEKEQSCILESCCLSPINRNSVSIIICCCFFLWPVTDAMVEPMSLEFCMKVHIGPRQIFSPF